MSRFRGSPSRSPFRSPPRLYEVEREAIIEEQIRFKSAVKAQSDFRRMNDQLAILQVKVRHTNELQDKVEGLIRQNNQLARDNDQLVRQLSQKRYELQRLRITASQHHERESLRNGQLYQANKSLQLQIEFLKKQRAQATRIYESNIVKLQRMLDDKVIELDATTLKCSDLSKQLQITAIKFEQEKNRLKNIMTRTQHQLQRQLEYTKQKGLTEKFSQIDTLKRNYSAQVALLQDQISKLKMLNQVKTEQFEAQLAENKNLRKRHDEQVRILNAENDDLRARMLKLQEINRSEVQNIQVKYNDYHTQGTTNMKEQHGRQITLLLDQIDKLKWLAGEKNAQIQNLVQDKKQLRRTLDQKQLQLQSQISTLKNQKYAQAEQHAQDSHDLMSRINQLINKSLRDSEAYHARALQFRDKILKLQSQINDKQNQSQLYKKQSQSKIKQLNRNINQLNFNLQKTKRDLSDSQDERVKAEARNEQYKRKAQNEIKQLSTKLNHVQVKLQQTSDNLRRQSEDNSGKQGLLLNEIKSLKETITIIEQKLSTQQRNHSAQMNQFTSNMNDKFKRLQSTHKKTLEQLQVSFKQQLQALNLRLEKVSRQKNNAEEQLKRYIAMYSDLQKYFKNPHDGQLFEQKSKDSIYKVLEGVSKSSIHIF